ncbi:jmjC domain-containing protein [Artemisia annua]|uniref:JmjC domain-containing protein n=1 Tax=Artemisia annua TaxID=35608 RepID=A0A2U1PB48_ARTAN|nr:jmjC domain-containing protein [Artemisia annua]
MDPRMDIGYGDSVTKLHYAKSDTVNVLTHTNSAEHTSTKSNKADMAKRNTGVQDEDLAYDTMEGGALWDIFRRRDVPNLIKYFNNHLAEFKHADCSAVDQLKIGTPQCDAAGIKTWTFRQKLGDAVFVPAGCPNQVRNLKSCTKVEVNFVSPESVSECIRLQHELRMFPDNHRAKEDMLNIGKMMINALDQAVVDVSSGRENDGGLAKKELLQVVEQCYPDTIQRVQIRSKPMWQLILKELHLLIKCFVETSMDELTKYQLTKLQEDFNEFENLGFNLSWAQKKLDLVQKIRFGNEPLLQEIMALEESLKSSKQKFVEMKKQFEEAREKLEKTISNYDSVADARNNKARELAEARKFGDGHDGQLGFNMLPG